jgi:phosphatidylglycerophosphate synthase
VKKELHPLEKASDGPVSLLINRRISRLFSGPLARMGVSPSVATLMALGIGAVAAGMFALHIWWLGGVLLQFSSVFSGVDGEIARRTRMESRYGDFFDTIVDRFAEYAGLLAIAYGLEESWGNWAWFVGLLAVGGTFMLASASEKYRSTMHENYPKRQFEPLFAYLASGRDVRVFIIMVGAIAATWNVDIMFWTVVAVAALLHVNFLWRVLILRTRMAG